jgi:hypothetical protein
MACLISAVNQLWFIAITSRISISYRKLAVGRLLLYLIGRVAFQNWF